MGKKSKYQNTLLDGNDDEDYESAHGGRSLNGVILVVLILVALFIYMMATWPGG